MTMKTATSSSSLPEWYTIANTCCSGLVVIILGIGVWRLWKIGDDITRIIRTSGEAQEWKYQRSEKTRDGINKQDRIIAEAQEWTYQKPEARRDGITEQDRTFGEANYKKQEARRDGITEQDRTFGEANYKKQEKKRVYLYTNVNNDIIKAILKDELGGAFDVEDLSKEEPKPDDVVLVYYYAPSRPDNDIAAALNGAPGTLQNKVLVMFNDKANDDQVYIHPRPITVRSDVRYVAFLCYSEGTKTLLSTPENKEQVSSLKKQLSSLPVRRTSV